jgi:hypothetical protein
MTTVSPYAPSPPLLLRHAAHVPNVCAHLSLCVSGYVCTAAGGGRGRHAGRCIPVRSGRAGGLGTVGCTRPPQRPMHTRRAVRLTGPCGEPGPGWGGRCGVVLRPQGRGGVSAQPGRGRRGQAAGYVDATGERTRAAAAVAAGRTRARPRRPRPCASVVSSNSACRARARARARRGQGPSWPACPVRGRRPQPVLAPAQSHATTITCRSGSSNGPGDEANCAGGSGGVSALGGGPARPGHGPLCTRPGRARPCRRRRHLDGLCRTCIARHHHPSVRFDSMYVSACVLTCMSGARRQPEVPTGSSDPRADVLALEFAHATRTEPPCVGHVRLSPPSRTLTTSPTHPAWHAHAPHLHGSAWLSSRPLECARARDCVCRCVLIS